MRIVQVITRPQRRGAEIFATQLSQHLLNLGHEVVLVSLFQGEQGLEFSGPWIKLDLPGMKKLDLSGFRKLAKALKAINPDIVQANASDTLRMSVGSRLFFKGKYQLVYRNANQMSRFIKGPIQRVWNKWLLNQVDAVVSVSGASRIDLIQSIGFKKKIEAIPIGIAPDEIRNKQSKESDTKFPFSYLLNMGAWAPEKNQTELIKTFKDSNSPEAEGLHLVLMGSGRMERQLIQLVKDLDLEPKVHFLPNQGNPFPILTGAKALVLPSKIEGLPAVILEAMYCRIPVIAYGVGGIPEVLKNGETGWCIKPGDQQAFANAIKEVLTMDESAKTQILNQAFQLVDFHFTLPQITHQFEIFYKDLLSPTTF